MKRLKVLAILLTGFISVNTLKAQEVLTLKQVIQFALDNKKEAQTAKLDLENSEYKISEVRAGALPQVTGTGSLTFNPMLQKVAIPGELFGEPGKTVMAAFGQKWQSQANLSVTQQLFNQSVFTGLKAARTTREFYQINSQLTEEQLIEKVANAYYEVFQTQLQLQTIQNNLENTTKTQKVIKGLLDAGLSKKIDYDRVTVAINNLESQKQQVINAHELQKNALKFAIGMDITKDIQLPKETFETNSGLVLADNDVDARTEIKILNKQNELLELNKKATIAELYPKLSFTGNLGYLGMGNAFPIFNKSEGVNWSGFSGLGLNLSVPIFKGGETKAKVSQADIELRKLKVEIEDTKLALSLANENAKSQIKNSLLTVNSNRENVNLAKEVMENTQNNFKNGLATLTELLDSENAFADAESNLNISLLNYKVAEIQLIKSAGNLKSLVK